MRKKNKSMVMKYSILDEARTIMERIESCQYSINWLLDMVQKEEYLCEKNNLFLSIHSLSVSFENMDKVVKRIKKEVERIQNEKLR
jgi:hypothetical protein